MSEQYFHFGLMLLNRLLFKEMLRCVCVCVLTGQLRNADLASRVRMSWSVNPVSVNNLIPVLQASLYQRHQTLCSPPVLHRIGVGCQQFIFLLAEPCEVWLAAGRWTGLLSLIRAQSEILFRAVTLASDWMKKIWSWQRHERWRSRPLTWVKSAVAGGA